MVRVTLVLDLAHDGSPDVVGSVLLAETVELAERLDLTVMDQRCTAEMREEGDPLSPLLPAFGPYITPPTG